MYNSKQFTWADGIYEKKKRKSVKVKYQMRRVGNTSKGTERMAIIRGKEIKKKKVLITEWLPFTVK